MLLPTNKLTLLLNSRFPDLAFALLFGSSKEGSVATGSDVDLGIWISKGVNKAEFILMLSAELESAFPEFVFDLSILNEAGPVLRFEALNGKVLFVREGFEEVFADFYSGTCAEYTDFDFWMTKQLEYRGYEVRVSR